MNDLIKIIQNRHCKRSFLEDPVPVDIIKSVLSAASQAPSSKNTQPWQVAVVAGNPLEKLRSLLCSKFDRGDQEEPDYTYMTHPTPEFLKERARSCGYSLFELKGIDREDRQARLEHDRKNYELFGAPLALFFHLHQDSEPGNFLDMGLFLQNVMLGFESYGLGSCPQFSLMRFTQSIKQFLSLKDDSLLVCGMAVGFPVKEAIINSFIPERVPLDDFVRWFD